MAAVVDAFVAAYILNPARSAIRRCSTGAIGRSAFGTKQTLMPTMSMSAVVDAFVAAYILNRSTGSIGTSASGT